MSAYTQMTKKQRLRSINAVKEAIYYMGSAIKLAKKLKVTSQYVYKWKSDLKNSGAQAIPIKFAIKIDEITEGHVKKEDLRPDIFYDTAQKRRLK